MAGRMTKQIKRPVETNKDNKNMPIVHPDEQKTLGILPTELLGLIISRLSLRDNIRVSALCKRMLAVAMSVRVVDKAPFLLLFPKYGNSCEFYDPSERKIYSLELPELLGSRICYAKDEWLLFYNPLAHKLFFFCPYTRELIRLPNLIRMCQVVAFSAAPTSPSCLLLGIRDVCSTFVEISTCRPGASEWITVTYHADMSFFGSEWNKFVFCNGFFYCLSVTGHLGVYDPDNATWDADSFPAPDCAAKNFIENFRKRKFMVEHNGDIFVIYTCSEINPIIYKLDQTNKVWVQMETLGGATFFDGFLNSHARANLIEPMINNIYFPNLPSSRERCISYSLDNGSDPPHEQCYRFKSMDPLESAWIKPPDDLSIFH